MTKLIYDNIHGYIEIDSIAKKIIDTPEFQRLRYIHQTGVLFLVFPTANHSRFEHSIGVYHLAKQMISNIKNKQPELNITNKLVLLVSLAGLCHDLGHLIYSHLFDDLFLKKLPNYKDLGKNVEHEERSKLLVKHIVNKYKINLTDNDLKVIIDLIDPKSNNYNEWKEEYKVGKWIFQIVSNPINSIDVDKFDYIDRDNKAVGLKLNFEYGRLLKQAKVIEDNIHYPIQVKDDIYHLFFVRYRLHKQIYNHKTVKALEILLVEALFELEKTNKISDYINHPEKMIRLTDMYLHFCDNKNVLKILNKIELRQVPKLVEEIISSSPKNSKSKKLEDEIIIKSRVGYCKDMNPLKNIKFYSIKENTTIDFENFSLLINNKFQEFFYRKYKL